MNDIIIIGGGLAGLFNALLLNRAGFKVLLLEKKNYPFHRVCGEYLSNELIPFLNHLNINLNGFNFPNITELEITTPSGKKLCRNLGLGGFGLSRYTFDNHMYRMLLAEGVEVRTNTPVLNVHFTGDFFEVDVAGETLVSPLVIGAFGKRSTLDQKMNRPFITRRSPFIGVKYHIKTDAPASRISLHNFKNGYCGLNKVDDERYCLCYLAHRNDLRNHGSIAELEKNVLFQNPFLQDVFVNARFLWDKPETINEISFEKKAPVEQHVLMSGDTAGMIAPLCGNGMSMAIHSACILSSIIQKHYRAHDFSTGKRSMLEQDYTRQWNRQFATRLYIGRQIQHVFGREKLTDTVISLMKASPFLSRKLISQTHGKPFLPSKI